MEPKLSFGIGTENQKWNFLEYFFREKMSGIEG
jgi:hypothetical protein